MTKSSNFRWNQGLVSLTLACCIIGFAVNCLGAKVSKECSQSPTSQGRGARRLEKTIGQPIITGCEPRIALVIGNNRYESLDRLKYGVRDADMIEQALLRSGFRIVSFSDSTGRSSMRDLSLAEMKEAIRLFFASLRPGVVALLYYAGHGSQMSGENFLFPVDFDKNLPEGSPAAVASSISVTEIYKGMIAAKTKLNIVILDTCRDNGRDPPAKQPWSETILTELALQANSFVAFSAKPGQQAIDGLYTEQLVRSIDPGIELRELFKNVQHKVEKLRGPMPYSTDSYNGDFCFHPPNKFINSQDELAYLRIPPISSSSNMASIHLAGGRSQSDFWMGQTEVTVGAYKNFTKSTGRTMPKHVFSINPEWRFEDLPMFKVSWKEAQAYCKWAGGRLPSASEWLFAASVDGDRDSPLNKRTDSERVNVSRIKGAENWRYGPKPVRNSRPNSFGLHNLMSNVKEWVDDWFEANSETGKNKVVLGCSWAEEEVDCRLNRRGKYSPDSTSSDRGFRCVLETSPCLSCLPP